MNILCKFTCVLAILTFTLNTRMCVQITHEKSPETMSGDFESFLNSLGSMVYKYKKATRSGGGQSRHEYAFTSTTPTQISMRNESIYKAQKSVLRDVLMMKLVSYYENKYKITDNTPTIPDISAHSEHNIVNDANALSQMKRSEYTQSNLKSVVENPNEANQEVLVI